jgi:predicted N-acetyltransferase YhbS
VQVYAGRTVSDVSIECLADRPELVPVMAEWHWGDDDRRTTLDFWVKAHAAEAVGRDVPTAWVALRGGRPVGCVSLIAHNMSTHPELTPWLAALFVLPEERGKGVGRRLARRCEAHASRLGYPNVFLYTEAAEAFYARLGWRTRSIEEYEAEPVTVMEKALSEDRLRP